ncbi:DNA/RNA non-specific endonuclease [Leptothrix discophora]|uniref:DNA/RNA non-specific endonuclease n=1 Tax=Leptothrix discophora TaxID=89 RepID=A0ABT9G0N5_LEPDI|nr:DNA/RNA non-specific endonuclease [Leptothrix discophora]MDP4300049.1 DNA/RNA non-specific endonuclease [Leptothrix discophora]
MRLPALTICLILMTLGACGGGGADAGKSVFDPSGDNAGAHRVVPLNHGAYQLDYDCDDRLAVRYAYTLTTDTGHAVRPDVYTQVDPLLPAGCPAQLSANAYAAPGWARGHLVAANHMDASDALIAQTFLMSNIVPQRAAFNQGIWAEAEAIAECWRDVAPVQVIGGVLANDSANDLFRTSHGVATPDVFWMILVSADPARPGQQRALAWWIPNIDATGTLESRRVSIATIEARVGASRVGLPALAAALKTSVGAAWGVPAGGCLAG